MGTGKPPDDSFAEALRRAEPRPADLADRELKKNYAERLSNALAVLVAGKLRAVGGFAGIVPEVDGTGRESASASGAGKKLKKTDVRYATRETGLELLVSIKTLNFRDPRKDPKTGETLLGRYTKNMVRNDHELRAEAMDHHDRFPYAVLVALFFLPVDACEDGKAGRSSFAHAVLTFRPRTGRVEHTDPPAKFERVFIGLYDPRGGDPRVGFFDVANAPPRVGRPPWPEEEADPKRGGRLYSLDGVVSEIVRAYGIRNGSYIRWADERPTDVPEVEPPSDVDADDPFDPDSE